MVNAWATDNKFLFGHLRGSGKCQLEKGVDVSASVVSSGEAASGPQHRLRENALDGKRAGRLCFRDISVAAWIAHFRTAADSHCRAPASQMPHQSLMAGRWPLLSHVASRSSAMRSLNGNQDPRCCYLAKQALYISSHGAFFCAIDVRYKTPSVVLFERSIVPASEV